MSFCYVAVEKDGVWGVKEIYFGAPYSDDPKHIALWTEEFLRPTGETYEELIECLESMLHNLKNTPNFKEVDEELKVIEKDLGEV